jgi:hypothetical protein
VVHLRSGISNDLDVFWEEFVSVLQSFSVRQRGRKSDVTRPKSAGKVFFFARSPEAPRTMMTVFSLSSLLLGMMVLVIERASRFIADHEGQRKAARLICSSKKTRTCLPSRFGVLRLNHCIRHRECNSVSVTELDGKLFRS